MYVIIFDIIFTLCNQHYWLGWPSERASDATCLSSFRMKFAKGVTVVHAFVE